MIKAHFSDDTSELLFLFAAYEVQYLIIGGEAVIYYGYARLTGDIDLFYNATPQNIQRVHAALLQFWDGDIPGLMSKEELLDKDAVFQFGVPPNRIDLLSDITNISFEDAWRKKVIELVEYEGQSTKVYYIGLDHLIKNKQAVKRPKDQEDLKFLLDVRARRT